MIPMLMMGGVALRARRDQPREHLRQSALWRQRFLEGIGMWTFVGMMVFLVLLGLLMAGASTATDAAARKRKAADRERRWKQWQDL